MADKKPVPVDLPEEELRKLAGKTVKKGEDEYFAGGKTRRWSRGWTLACVASTTLSPLKCAFSN